MHNEVEQINESQEGLMQEAHPGQELTVEVDGVKYSRFPIKTRMILFDDDLIEVTKKYALPHYQEDDIYCIASKVVSITKGFYVKESELKVTPLARFLVRFITKHPHDPGFAIPEKVQVAMNEAGWFRFTLAVFVGGFLKLLGFKGWFYRIAGNNVGAIDGFVPHLYPPELRGYGFLAPKNPDGICQEIESKLGMQTAILDGNNVENIVLGMSPKLKARFTKQKLLEILKGNPQAQTGNTPMLIVKKV